MAMGKLQNRAKHIAKRMQTECNKECTNNAMLEKSAKRLLTECNTKCKKCAINNGPSGVDNIMQNYRNPSAIRLQFEYNVKKRVQ